MTCKNRLWKQASAKTSKPTSTRSKPTTSNLKKGTTPFAFGFIPSEAVYQYLTECHPTLVADAVAGAYFQKYEKQNDEYVKIIEHKVGFFKYLWK